MGAFQTVIEKYQYIRVEHKRIRNADYTDETDLHRL